MATWKTGCCTRKGRGPKRSGAEESAAEHDSAQAAGRHIDGRPLRSYCVDIDEQASFNHIRNVLAVAFCLAFLVLGAVAILVEYVSSPSLKYLLLPVPKPYVRY